MADLTPLDDLRPDGLSAAFLRGVPAQTCLTALALAGGDEIGSGKLLSPESSAALAINAFGWFLERPNALPPLPNLTDLDWPALKVDVERQMRFPWSGGRHPWLDAAVETGTALIGIESKRFEPFRDTKTATLSDAYDRDVWGEGMEPFTVMRNALRMGGADFQYLDAVQLVKHAFGLVSEGRRTAKHPILFYVFAEPAERAGQAITPEALLAHRSEIDRFADAVAGADVRFAACSYREWVSTWTGAAAIHGQALLVRFAP